jgi:hypothetical protein
MGIMTGSLKRSCLKYHYCKLRAITTPFTLLDSSIEGGTQDTWRLTCGNLDAVIQIDVHLMARDDEPVGQNSDLNRIVNMAISHSPKCHEPEGHWNNKSMESVLRTCRLKTIVHDSGRSGHAFQ